MRRSIVLGLAALMFQLGGAMSVQSQSPRDGAGYFPNRPVLNQNGEKLRFFDDVIKGRMVVISFIYTSCTDICPLTTARLGQVADELGDAVGRDVFFVSITVDPKNDTPAKLKAFAQAFHLGPGWIFLTGTMADIRAINAKLGEQMRSLNEHRNEIVLGNDATGEWARNSAFGDLKRLVLDIRAMDPKWRNAERRIASNPASNTGYALSAEPGQALFQRLCAGCHTFKVGDRVGPDLYGAASRRPHGWLTRFIMSPERVRAEKDPVALSLAVRFPGVRMPNLGLSEADASDLVSYINSRSNWLDAQRTEASRAMPAKHEHNHHHKH